MPLEKGQGQNASLRNFAINFVDFVVMLLACGARGPGSILGLAATISEIGYLLLQSRDIAEISLNRHKSSNNQPTN